MKVSRKSLFGGALLSAGLVTAGAEAQQFVLGNSYAHVYVGANYTSDYDFFSGGGAFSIGASASDNYASAYGANSVSYTQMAMSTSASSSGPYAYVHNHDSLTYFMVDQNVTANLNWDWTQASFGYLQVYDQTNFTQVAFEIGNTSGSSQVSLTAGNQYFFRGSVDANLSDGAQSGYTTFTVPGPGSAGLLGLAGLAAARRRRTVQRNR